MASSSSSSPPPLTWKYDVFPSFSGQDVRKSFLSHLIKALRQKSIITFIDDDMERSCRIAPVLLYAIRQSRISIVVFSNKYATSTWCLNELAEIHECSKKSGYLVIPIFYNVDTSDVRNQRGEFGKAFEETCKSKSEDDKIRWKNALYELAGVAGYDSRNGRDEAWIIELITNDVFNKLVTTPFDDFADYVGIQTHIEEIMSLLSMESGGVRMVGIVGTSGIGKTTIARALYNRLSSHFDHCVFTSYKRTIQDDGMDDYSVKLRWAKQFLSKTLGQDIKVGSLGVVKQRFKDRKVLIVLDNVTEIDLLDALVGHPRWFGFGSRIIVTTQDRALLESHEINLVHKMEFPSKELALQMFCRSAFKQNFPPDGFRDLAVTVAKLASNLPLGLNVLGSSLRGKKKEKWVEMMPRLQNGLNGKIGKTLRACYDGLEEKDVQDIFLYIACLFNGESVNYINNLLDTGLYTGVRSMLTTLADKSLIRLTPPPRETVQMHILLEKLGREIVREESIHNAGERRFLLDANDICDVFQDNTGTDKVVAITCDLSEIKEPLSLDKEIFRRMHNIQFIKLSEGWGESKARLHLPQGLDYLPRKLRLLRWHGYPAKCIPSSFSAKYLVELKMTNSKLEKLWEGTLPLPNLEKMDLSESSYLEEIPDLSNATNLEKLYLYRCTSLVTLPCTIRNLKKLKSLGMFGCSNLTALPIDVDLFSLDFLELDRCSRLRSFPQIANNISMLYLDGTIYMEEEDCFWIANLRGLTELHWRYCPLRCMPSNFDPQYLKRIVMEDSKLEKLWEGVQTLRYLETMDLSGCRSLEEIPDLSTAINLKYMDFLGCENLKEIPDLSAAIDLVYMDFSGCENLTEIPDLPTAINMEYMNFSGCKNLKEIRELQKATEIEALNMGGCTSVVMLPSSIQHLHQLESLDMRGCTSLKVIPTNINLVSLLELNLNGCSRLTSFPQISTSIEELFLDDTAIEEVPSWIENMAGLVKLSMIGCKKLRKIAASISNLKNLWYADFTNCGRVKSDTVTDRALLMACYREGFIESIDSGTMFIFCNSFNLNRDAQELIGRSDFHWVALPGKEVPKYFTHQTCGTSLVVPLPQRPLAQNSLRFKACVVLDYAIDDSHDHFYQFIIVHSKLRGATTGTCEIDPAIVNSEMDHLVVFHFDFFPLQEVDPPLSNLDCNSVEFEFKIRCYGGRDEHYKRQPCTLLHNNIKGCGVKLHDVSDDRSSETEYTHRSRESDVETGRSKKRMRMTTISQEPSSLPCGQSACDTSIPNVDMELSLGSSGASGNLNEDEISLHSSYPCLEGEALSLDRTIREEQDTEGFTRNSLSCWNWISEIFRKVVGF